MRNIILESTTKLVTDQMSDQELITIYMAATAGFNPKLALGYKKAQSLFTEDDGTKMHSATLEALDTIFGRRFCVATSKPQI